VRGRDLGVTFVLESGGGVCARFRQLRDLDVNFRIERQANTLKTADSVTLM
jgi:hypothetical protein